MQKLSLVVIASIAALGFSFGAFAGDRMPMHHMKGGHHMMHGLMDANKDGSVDEQEFKNFRNQHFSKADKNGDGVLTKKEFLALAVIMKEQRQKAMEMAKQKRAQKHFDKLDVDGNGKISKAEFDAKGQRSFIRMDQNDDGVLNKADRRKKMHKMKRMEHSLSDK
ncbi:MAG: EF-hand domain-containing protein [Emcibacter sp.]|nr:EF-hand domain-containing protein [Emcibacter sp.]